MLRLAAKVKRKGGVKEEGTMNGRGCGWGGIEGEGR